MKFTVLRDSGEHKGHGWQFAPSKACAGTEVRNLYTGDYSLDGYYDNKLLVLERKATTAELAGNLTHPEKWDDFRQVLERMEEFRWPFLVLEFSLKLVQSYPVGSGIPKSHWGRLRVSGAFLLKRLNEIEMVCRTKVVFAGSPEAAQAYALGLFKRAVELVPSPPR